MILVGKYWYNNVNYYAADVADVYDDNDNDEYAAAYADDDDDDDNDNDDHE